MTIIPLGEKPPAPQPAKGLAPFALGFRPFFILAAVSGVALLGIWLAIWSGLITPPLYYGVIGWHSHEMLFGYTTAVIAGFLLTAVKNWTGVDTLKGLPLALLALLWLLARLAPFVPLLPHPLIAILDLGFLPLLALALYGPLMQARNRSNRLFLPLLMAMALANLLVHLESLQIAPLATQGWNLMLDLVLLLLAWISGRVLPFFTEKAISGAKPVLHRRREQLLFGLMIAWTLSHLFYPQPWLLVPLAAAIAFYQVWRLLDWRHPQVWRVPILWVLYTGMLWLALGFVLKSLALLGVYPDNLATHALTSGAIGVTTLGMMSRVALGHTGRSLQPPRLVEYGFILVNIAVVLRAFAPFLVPDKTYLWIQTSGILWGLCFALFSFYYLPILFKARIDGRPG
jgi:uncharacterized protein involved in response to NO